MTDDLSYPAIPPANQDKVVLVDRFSKRIVWVGGGHAGNDVPSAAYPDAVEIRVPCTDTQQIGDIAENALALW